MRLSFYFNFGRNYDFLKPKSPLDVRGQRHARIFFNVSFERSYDVLKSKSPYFLLN